MITLGNSIVMRLPNNDNQIAYVVDCGAWQWADLVNSLLNGLREPSRPLIWRYCWPLAVAIRPTAGASCWRFTGISTCSGTVQACGRKTFGLLLNRLIRFPHPFLHCFFRPSTISNALKHPSERVRNRFQRVYRLS